MLFTEHNLRVGAMSWLAGFVKEVQSGDTLVIASASTLPNGMLAERRLNLASLSAPRMVWAPRLNMFLCVMHGFLGSRCRLSYRKDSGQYSGAGPNAFML